MFNDIWTERFLKLAREFSTWSKDPSTQVGAVVVNDQRIILGHGYNGFPRGVVDSVERYINKPVKYSMVVHAEINAILNVEVTANVRGATLFLWPLPPCNECAKIIIQSGIKHVVYPKIPADMNPKWLESFKISKTMFLEADITLQQYGRKL